MSYQMTAKETAFATLEAECRNLQKGQEITGLKARSVSSGISMRSIRLIAQVYDVDVVKVGTDYKITRPDWRN